MESMTQSIALAGILGLAFGALQLLLMRRVLFARVTWQRALLMALKLPLWALAFMGMILWWGVWPLVAFAFTAGALYLVVSIVYYVRTRKGE